jgi:hypothetical protein
MSLLRIDALPPGGWIYTQSETGWKLRSMDPFRDAAKQVASHRVANNLPRSTVDEAAVDLDAATCQRLGNDPQWCADVSFAQKKMVDISSPGGVQLAGDDMFGTFKQVRIGAEVLFDWLGMGGKPVEPSKAQLRADVCLNQCSTDDGFNKVGKLWQKMAGNVARAIHDQMLEKENRSIKVQNEDRLGTCQICQCHLPLLVQVPAAILAEREPPDRLAKYPAWCWKKREIESELTATTETTN